MWAELTASRADHITSKPVCSFSTRHWTLLLESLEVSSMVAGGTSFTARCLTGSASLCRYALLAAMLSPKLESEKLHRKASLTQKSSHQKWDSQKWWEVWEGRGFKEQGQPPLHTLSVVGCQGQREGSHNPLVLVRSDKKHQRRCLNVCKCVHIPAASCRSWFPCPSRVASVCSLTPEFSAKLQQSADWKTDCSFNQPGGC